MRKTPFNEFVFVHRFETSEADNPACGGAAILVGGRRFRFHPARIRTGQPIEVMAIPNHHFFRVSARQGREIGKMPREPPA